MAAFASESELEDLTGEAIATAKANTVLAFATALIREHTGQHIEQVEDDAVEFEGRWGRVLWLPQRPVTAVSSVSIREPAGTTVALTEGTDYTWTRRGKLLRINHVARLPRALPGHWGGDHGLVSVTYTHGYVTIPDNVKQACLLEADRVLHLPGGVRQETVGSYSVTYDAAELPLTGQSRVLLRRLLTPASAGAAR